jgi:UDP-glucose-4-epimerase GalE
LRVLVTGGAGYIGSHVVKALREANHSVAVVDNLEQGHLASVSGVDFRAVDLNDRRRLSGALDRIRPDAVAHLAGLSLVGESTARPDAYRYANVEGSRALFSQLIRRGIQSVVYSSSAAIYGVPETVPVSEEAPLRPINPYGETKADVEQLLREAAKGGALRSVSLRYFNAAGASPQGDLGEDHRPETHLLPLALQAASGQLPELVIYGADYPTPDGTCIRDYVHPSDVARAHVMALAALTESAPSRSPLQCHPTFRAYNLGAGRGHSVFEVLEMLERVTGQPVPRSIGPRRPGDPPVLVARIDSIRRDLGWVPRLSDLQTIVRTAWAWHCSHPYGYRHPASAPR